MRWMLLMLVMGCEPAEPAAPDWDRCMDDGGPVARTNCCYKAGESDCKAGFLAIEALHGPQNGAQPQAAADFARQCELDMAGDWPDLYCEGYCAACPDYIDWWTLTNSVTDWGGEEGTPEDWRNDCDCRAFGGESLTR
tara:strand:- start:1779 stop:2192 length:414 start_codon:yes stop_codon:yes gene_type:complete